MNVSEEDWKRMDKNIAKELEPFLDGIRTKHADCELFKQAYNDSQARLSGAVGIVAALMSTRELADEFVKDIVELFTYLGFVESVGNIIVNLIVMLLVANGKDFHIECRYATPRIKHAVSIKDLEEERVPLTTKLNFLRDNKVTALASVIDSDLRNKVAHLRFDVRRASARALENTPLYEFHKRDRIFIEGKPASEKASYSSRKLLDAIGSTLLLIDQLAKAKGLAPKKASQEN